MRLNRCRKGIHGDPRVDGLKVISLLERRPTPPLWSDLDPCAASPLSFSL